MEGLLTFKLIERREIAEDTFAVWFTKPEGFEYQAGQFVHLWLSVDPLSPKENVRSMSLASAPHEEHLMTAMRMSESKFKQAMLALEPGAEFQISQPRGHLVMSADDSRHHVFLAAGIGFTPFRGMIMDEKEKGFPRKLTLLYSNRFQRQIAFFDEISEIQHSNFRTIFTLTQENNSDWNGLFGRIDAAMLKNILKDEVLDCVYYIVGVPSFVTDMQNILLSFGVVSDQIHVEKFSGYEKKS